MSTTAAQPKLKRKSAMLNLFVSPKEINKLKADLQLRQNVSSGLVFDYQNSKMRGQSITVFQVLAILWTVQNTKMYLSYYSHSQYQLYLFP